MNQIFENIEDSVKNFSSEKKKHHLIESFSDRYRIILLYLYYNIISDIYYEQV